MDIFLGNHCWNNHTREKYEANLTARENPFIDPEGWVNFLNNCDVEAFAKELETQIEMLEKACGESLYDELPAVRDPAQLRETEQHLRKKLA